MKTGTAEVVARNLRRLRLRTGLSGRELARRAGLFVDHVNAIEFPGRYRRGPRIDTLLKLATALSVDLNELLVERKEKKKGRG